MEGFPNYLIDFILANDSDDVRKLKVPPSYQADELAAEIKQLNEVVGLRVQRDVSLHPPGDVPITEMMNRAVNCLLGLLDEREIGREPSSVIAPLSTKQIEQDSNNDTWEEMEAIARNQTNMNANVLLLMVIAAAIAAIGIATNALPERIAIEPVVELFKHYIFIKHI